MTSQNPKDKNKQQNKQSPQLGKQTKEPKKATDWDLESPYAAPATIEDLINLAPFKEASDSKGGSYTAAARIPTWLERKIQWFIEMKGSPYMLKGDVIRDMIYLGARVLHARYKGNPDWIAEAKMTEAVNRAQITTSIREQINTLEKGLANLWGEGDEEMAIGLLEDFMTGVDEMEDQWIKLKKTQYAKNSRIIRQVAEKCSPATRKIFFGT